MTHATYPQMNGTCYVVFAFDIGQQVDVERASKLIVESRLVGIEPRQRAPKHFEFRQKPMRVSLPVFPVSLGSWQTAAEMDFVVYEFGAISATFRIPLTGAFDGLLELSDQLYDNQMLFAEAQRHVEGLMKAIESAIGRPRVSTVVEDYVMFHLSSVSGEAGGPREIVTRYRQEVAQILRSERQLLSEQEIEDATGEVLSYTPDDGVVVNWNAAFIFGREVEDVRAVLEFANVHLLELRYLDRQLDKAIDQSWETLTRRRVRGLQISNAFDVDLRRVAQLQLDSAILFEGVSNALKLLGDQFLSRVYRAAARELYLNDWDKGIARKLGVVETIYDKLDDRISSVRMEIMEFTIIVLILVSIVLPFVIPYGK